MKMNFNSTTDAPAIKIYFHYTLRKGQRGHKHVHGKHQKLVEDKGDGHQLSCALAKSQLKILKKKMKSRLLMKNVCLIKGTRNCNKRIQTGLQLKNLVSKNVMYPLLTS